MELTRRQIREKALQALYPFDFQQEITKEDAISYALEIGNQSLFDEETGMFIPEYLDQLVSGVIEHQAEIDRKIEEHLKGWNIARVAKTDLIIMRIAIYEMLNEETPSRVALNEAIELAKMYCDHKSPKFVNGVLSNVMNQLDSEKE
ncbi:transcription antitermination factor NusB [Vagococcus xieshaowenii]|uniref:Transcription antitermination protein NusB n=1 Tax=Vagococcus xieshaowenii TaxID=2562451 RepID=A0AAJ5JM34_9ENTE|nr:transcription antitermination factor NusB [Vagococcus xieshaowenii]QCA28284.1 transcription antitermination factor NusB [Vagococcus xieshaowenii]TFZ42328.1 transcription antitermination factor NusB [Vagococcus xieshaowenii]